MEIFNISFDKFFDNRHLCTDDYQNNSRLLSKNIMLIKG